jgi:hypothetical protein
MIRKFVLALGATAIIVSAALAPTAASAKHKHHHHNGLILGASVLPLVVAGPVNCYYTKQKVFNGIFWSWQTVQICE